ncbi:MAG: TerC family protein [Alphaproteobacteria bacterium]|nr:TerC family protein [Alphaproteobacteria bacterium]
MASFDSILTATILGKPALLWLAFMAIVVALLAFDLGVLGRRRGRAGAGQGMTAAESLWLSAFYIGAGLAFGGWVWWSMGADSGLDYFTGFLVEKSLSLDNVFVIALIFSTLAIPPAYQHRVLFWGILGAIAMRAIMIAAGAALVSNFSWVLYLFGAFLVVTGVKMLWLGNREPDVAGNPLLRLMRRYMRVTDRLHGQHFLVRLPDPASGRNLWHATPLLLALALVEAADLIFAVDSVPAIFAITQDPFIVYTSNIFAILGLRALYFALASAIHRFVYLKTALSLVLVFIGAKIFLVGFVGKLPAWFSLGVVVVLIAGGILASLWRTQAGARPPGAIRGAVRAGPDGLS